MAAFEKYRSVYTHDELMERLRRIRPVELDILTHIHISEPTRQAEN